MSVITLLPLLVFTTCTTLIWAMRKYSQMADAQRTHAGKFPRSRPYPVTLPKALIRE